MQYGFAIATEVLLFASMLATGALLLFRKTDRPREKAVTAVFTVAMFVATLTYDCVAFDRGAIATISQVVLGWQNAFPLTVPFLFLIASVLALHFTVPHDDGTPYAWPRIVKWMLIYMAVSVLGMILGATWLSQHTHSDWVTWLSPRPTQNT